MNSCSTNSTNSSSISLTTSSSNHTTMSIDNKPLPKTPDEDDFYNKKKSKFKQTKGKFIYF